jgi:hypothetical protein
VETSHGKPSLVPAEKTENSAVISTPDTSVTSCRMTVFRDLQPGFLRNAVTQPIHSQRQGMPCWKLLSAASPSRLASHRLQSKHHACLWFHRSPEAHTLQIIQLLHGRSHLSS